MLDKLTDIVKSMAIWLSSHPNRLRMRGSRIEVIALILTRSPQPAVLLGQSPYHQMWMPPQEGVNHKEGFLHALRRCLHAECGISIPENTDELGDALHLRSIRFAGVVPLADERQGERPVSDEAAGTPLEKVKLRSKAYWLATILVADRSAISPKPDGRELLGLKWHNLDSAAEIIRKTNHAEKATLLLKCLDECRRDVFGAPKGGRTPPAARSEG